MNKRSILKIFVIMLVLASAVFITFSKKYNTKGNIKKSFPNIIKDYNKINEISFENKLEKYSLIKKNNEWYLKNYYNYPVDKKKINSFFLNLYDSNFLDTKETDLKNYYKLGVSYPLHNEYEANRIKIFSINNNILYDFILGKSSSRKTDYNVNYFRNSNQKLVYLLKNDLNIPKKEFSWIDTDLFKIDRLRIKEVSIKDMISKSFLKIYRDSYGDNEYKFYDMPKGYKLINNYSVNSLAAVFEGLEILDAIPYVTDPSNRSLKVLKNIKASTFDGLLLNFQLIKIKNDIYVRVRVKSDIKTRKELNLDDRKKIIGIPSMKKFKEVEEEEINMKFGENWLYKFDEFSTEQFNKSVKNFIEKKSE